MVRRRLYAKRKLRFTRKSLRKRASPTGGFAVVSRRAKRRRIRKARITRSPQYGGSIDALIPKMKTVWHTYGGSIDLSHDSNTGLSTTTWFAGTPANPLIFRCNSVYDPCNVTLSTLDKSANLYEYMARFYNRYEVLKSKITLTFMQKDVENGYNQDLWIGIRKSASSTLTGVPMSCAVADSAWRWKIMRNSPAPRAMISLSHTWNKYKDMSKEDWPSNITSAGYDPSSGPATFYFIPAYLSANGEVVGPNLQCIVRMSFQTRWSDRKEISADTDIIPDDP